MITSEKKESLKKEIPPEVRTQRLKPIWRALMICNLALGAYLFTAEKKSDKKNKSKTAESVASSPIAKEQVHQPILAEQQPNFAVQQPNVELRQPGPGQQANAGVLHHGPEDKQQELYNWMLGEQNRRKPNDHEEQKRIDEEKAILKEFIRSESTPRI